jgi:hypothetical protein
MISAAIPVAGFALSSMAKAITSLYQVTGEINTWVDKHLQDMQASDNLTVSRTGSELALLPQLASSPSASFFLVTL